MSYNAKQMLLVFAMYLFTLLLAIWPLPFNYMPYRPLFAALLICYLVVYRADLINLFAIVLMGIVYDAFCGNVLGQHALAFVLIAYTCSVLQLRIRMFGVLQQAAVIFLAIGIGQMAVNWVEALLYGQTLPVVFGPAITTALLWPFVMPLFQRLLRVGWNQGEGHD